jgi:hypothetical protein
MADAAHPSHCAADFQVIDTMKSIDAVYGSAPQTALLAPGSRAMSTTADCKSLIANCTGVRLDMNEEALNLSIRKFLKLVGISSQREIEHAVAKAAAAGTIAGTESFPAKMTLEIAGLKVNVEFTGEITLE